MKVAYIQKPNQEKKPNFYDEKIIQGINNINNITPENNKFNQPQNQNMNYEKDELLRNNNIFVSDIIKNDHVKFDKNSRSYLITLDSELVKAFSNLLKLSTYNNFLSINSVMDFYIMQIIVLEYDVRYNNAVKENIESEYKLLNENFRLKEDEIAFLRSRVSSLETGGDTEELFYQEINKIREMLREKTNELIKLDNFHNQTHNENRDKFNQYKEQNSILLEENEKLKEIFKDILNFHSNGQKKELDNILNYLKNNNTLFNEKQAEIRNEMVNDQNYLNNFNNIQEDSELKNINSTNNVNNFATQKEEFAEKVLNEFDKIFNDELKRVERYFKKDTINNKTIETFKKKSSIKRKSSAEKNYFEWRVKPQNEAWAETLRGIDSVKNSTQVTNNYRNSHKIETYNSNFDLDNLIEQSKNKLRNSLKSYENLNLNVISNNSNLNTNFNFVSSNTTKNINNANNNFSIGKENNISSSRNIGNTCLKEDSHSNNNGLMKNNSTTNIFNSATKHSQNKSQSPKNRNSSIKHSSSKKEVRSREDIEATLRFKLFKKK